MPGHGNNVRLAVLAGCSSLTRQGGMMTDHAVDRNLQAGSVVALLAASALFLGGCGGGIGESRAANLGKLVLRPAQVGRGYRAGPQHRNLPAQGVGGLCSGRLRSESMRTGRLAVIFINPGVPSSERVGVTNELVSYRVGDAQKAFGELRNAVTRCPPAYRLTLVSDPHLLAGYVALRVDIAGADHHKAYPYRSVWIYQVRGNILSLVFATSKTSEAVSTLTQAALHAAEESARNLASG